MWAVANYYFKQMVGLTSNQRIGLPDHQSQKWTNGFVWKGIFVRLIPCSKSAPLKRELHALKGIHIELDELRAIGKTLAKDFHLKSSGLQSHADIILPLISSFENCGFMLYGSPHISNPI